MALDDEATNSSGLPPGEPWNTGRVCSQVLGQDHWATACMALMVTDVLMTCFRRQRFPSLRVVPAAKQQLVAMFCQLWEWCEGLSASIDHPESRLVELVKFLAPRVGIDKLNAFHGCFERTERWLENVSPHEELDSFRAAIGSSFWEGPWNFDKERPRMKHGSGGSGGKLTKAELRRRKAEARAMWANTVAEYEVV